MTELHTPPSEAVAERIEPEHQRQEPAPPKRSGLLPGIIAIIVAVTLSAGLYYHEQRQTQRQSEALRQLESRLTELQRQHSQEQQQWQTARQRQDDERQALAQRLDALAQQSDDMRARLATLSNNDTKTWLLAQADFLVKLAGRKLWNDSDITTAGALLKSADASLADMNDPSLLEVRRALTHDIGTLAAISQIDFDGIVLGLNQLTDRVDELRLADSSADEAPMDENSEELSASISEWRQNLSKSWHNFLSDFITIRRRDGNAEPLLAPHQDVYLRENIRSRLLIAAQAVPRHQNEIYRQSLDTVATWVRAYFVTSDQATKAFLEQLDALGQQSIDLDVPSELQSQPLLDKLMQTRVRNLLAQPAAAQGD